ncbi:MAG: Hpt domain-containing protein [Treponema sp.]|jgi:HPt (histidine-containing phosphotransfer) domain-containing protein|nr:Hpt domain-containing protein [Treponema sp.]
MNAKNGFGGELAKIEGLDLDQGLYYAAESFETYASTLKQFSAGVEKGLALIRESLAAEDWNPYTVQAHAYKGICATIGAQRLSYWGKNLEAASKSEDKSACFAETGVFCSALADFNAALRRTSLFTEDVEITKTEIGATDMKARLAELAEACEEGGSTRINVATTKLEGLRLANADPGFEAALAEVIGLSRSMDYDEAAEKARMMSVELKNQN